MNNTYYQFRTRWEVDAFCDEVYAILSEPQNLVKWWPSVYLDVEVVSQGDDHGVGKKVSLYTKGWLPYTLLWGFDVTETRKPYGFKFKAYGDFVGEGNWIFIERLNKCEITFDWQITVNKPLLKRLSFILKPIFEMNHKWAMRKGFESLKLEIKRRKQDGGQESVHPPAPTFPHNFINNKIFGNWRKPVLPA